jgi:hypothetical protein
MEIDNKKFWGLDVNNIETLDDIKLIFAAMDLFVREDIPGFDKVAHLFTEDRIPTIVDEQVMQEMQEIVTPEVGVG